MKKSFVLFLILCILFSLLTTSVIAETNGENKHFYSGEIIIKVNRYIDTEKYTYQKPKLFCGILVKSAELLTNAQSEAEINDKLETDGYLEYLIVLDESNLVFDAIPKLNQRDDVIQAEPHYAEDNTPGKTLVGANEKGIEYNAFEVGFSSTEFIDPADYTTEGTDILYGIKITDITIYTRALQNNPTEEEIKKYLDEYGSIPYAIKTDSSVNEFEAIEILNDIESVIWAGLNYIGYPDEYYGTDNLCDINDDGNIEMMDYILLKRAYFGTYNLYRKALVRADVNKNDEIDMMDYILLKRVYFGTYTLV